MKTVSFQNHSCDYVFVFGQSPESGGMHWDYLPERRLSASRGSPENRIGRGRSRESAVQVGEKDQSLRQNASLGEPVEARPKLGASTTHRLEIHTLSHFVGLHVLHHRVEIEDVYALRPLAFEDRAHLGFEPPQLPRVHRAGAIDSDRNLAYTFSYA